MQHQGQMLKIISLMNPILTDKSCQDVAHCAKDLPLPPLIEWTWSLTVPTFVNGSIRARPTEPSHSKRQKACALVKLSMKIVDPATKEVNDFNILDGGLYNKLSCPRIIFWWSRNPRLLSRWFVDHSGQRNRTDRNESTNWGQWPKMWFGLKWSWSPISKCLLKYMQSQFARWIRLSRWYLKFKNSHMVTFVGSSKIKVPQEESE